MTADLPTSNVVLDDTTLQLYEYPTNITKITAVKPLPEMTTAGLFDNAEGDAGEDQMATSESGTSYKLGIRENNPRAAISNILKDKEQEWASVAAKQGPLELLDLPLDILKEIIKEVTHTNDLTALALTHSALHNLAIPHIYSRFDIVWPDAHTTTDPRTGVDALTYGLATLCMGDVFTDHSQSQHITCTNCGAPNIAECSHGLKLRSSTGQRRLGNQYPQFTRKFSLGNGPADWVQEYLITKESGKMLGTLVALAIARMINLEQFVWDMPTGVLRDVWLALSSLQNRGNPPDCRLERVWVRWHDNSETTNILPPQTSGTVSNNTMTIVGWTLPASMTISPQPHPLSYSQSRVEYPTLSALPPLKSLSVVDIDELEYLDEMSVLIAKSHDRLRELRVGISEKAVKRDFALPWDGPGLQQVDHQAQWPGASTIGERRLGGVLGVLLGRIFSIRKKPKAKSENKELSTPVSATPSLVQQGTAQALSSNVAPSNDVSHSSDADESSDALLTHIPETAEDVPEDWSWKENSPWKNKPTVSESLLLSACGIAGNTESNSFSHDGNGLEINPHNQLPSSSEDPDMDSLAALVSAQQVSPDAPQHEVTPEPALRRSQSYNTKQTQTSEASPSEQIRLDGKLRLQTLELERVSLSVIVLQKAFDWSVLTNLTILECAQHDRLWAMLRKTFAPSHGHSVKHGVGTSVQYQLNLKKIHTDAASPALISFLKETLAPNTLETLFLQDRKRSSTSNVTIDAIYRGPLKRHRASLKRLMLDSADRIPRSPTGTSDGARWRAWMPSRDVLNFITSGRMSGLRELSIAIEYKDWHHFLQRLPQVPHLRSLNIPFIADHVTPTFDPKELALQIVDVIVLRPEVELCYVGVSTKCFEILENRPHDDVHSSADAHSSTQNGGPGGVVMDEDEDEEDEASDEDDEEEEEEDDNGTAIGAPVGLDPDETESEMSDHDDSDTDSYIGSDDGRNKVKLRLREILFYDDKVSIFKARHGKL